MGQTELGFLADEEHATSYERSVLRPYQQNAVGVALEHRRGLLVLPTGSGKSHVIAGIVNGIEGRTLILQPTKEILESNYAKIVASGFQGATIYSASCGTKQVGKATYATIGSIVNDLHLFQNCEAVIIDEVHLTNAKGGRYDDLIKALDPAILIGLTATPYRLYANRDWGSQIKLLHRTRPRIFTDILHVTQCAELADQGFLVKPTYTVSEPGDRSLLRPNTTGSEYDERSMENYLGSIDITDRIVRAAKDAIDKGVNHILIFTPFLTDASRAEIALTENGIRTGMISGSTPKAIRERKLKRYRAGEIKAMVNVGVLTTGYDFPALDCIISSRPTMSLALYYQIIGRGVRPFPGKTRTLVYDLVDNYSRFGDPMEMQIVADSSGQFEVLSMHGRLTTRPFEAGHEMDEILEFGKHKGTKLKDVPREYLEWYCREGKMGSGWHQFAFEMERRKIFNGP